METINSNNLYLKLLKGGAIRKYRDIIALAIKDTINLNFPLNIKNLDNKTIEIVETLHKDGLKTYDSFLNDDFLSSILKKLEKLELSFSDKTSGKEIAKGSSVDHLNKYSHLYGHYNTNDLLNIEEIESLVNNPSLYVIPLAYFGCMPTLSTVSCWWSHPSEKSEGAQLFHQDRGDFLSLNLFIYLTDVDENSGAHEFCLKTHTFENLKSLLSSKNISEDNFWPWWERSHRKSDKDVASFFDIKTITGKAGSAFFEDTRGLHRGLLPKNKSRLVLELVWVLVPQFNSTLKPTKLIKTIDNLARYINRLAYKYERA